MASVDTDRNLLFGLLALQTGMIDQGALFTAFAAWIRDKSRCLADHLVILANWMCHAGPRSRQSPMCMLRCSGGDIERSLAVLAVGRSVHGGPDGCRRLLMSR